VLAEQHDDGQVARRYLGLDVIRACSLMVIDGDKEAPRQLLSPSTESLNGCARRSSTSALDRTRPIGTLLHRQRLAGIWPWR
jgi:hypothetical protein